MWRVAPSVSTSFQSVSHSTSNVGCVYHCLFPDIFARSTFRFLDSFPLAPSLFKLARSPPIKLSRRLPCDAPNLGQFLCREVLGRVAFTRCHQRWTCRISMELRTRSTFFHIGKVCGIIQLKNVQISPQEVSRCKWQLMLRATQRLAVIIYFARPHVFTLRCFQRPRAGLNWARV